MRVLEFVTAAFRVWCGFWTEIHLGRGAGRAWIEEIEEEYAEVDSHL